MKTTIDGAGRVVIPKPIRDQMGLAPGDTIEIDFDGWSITIDRAPGDAHVVERGGVMVVDGAGASMTDSDLRELRLDVQR
jgi:AbrB family looped-hinge helix DNA binding protein